MLSKRGRSKVQALDLPWRFAPRGTYHPEDNPDGLISFATAENTLNIEEVTDFVNRCVEFIDEDFLYRGSHAGGIRFPKALAVHLNEYLNPHSPLSGEDIHITNAATSLHETLAWCLADEGDKILTSRPVYGRFELDFGNRSNIKIWYADTTAEHAFDEDVVNAFETAMRAAKGSRIEIRALLLVNPHNPLGRCYPRNTLIRLMQFCQKHYIHLLSDEIYACSVFDSGGADATPFTSVLSIDPEGLIDTNLVHVIYGMSKDFGVAGLRVGALISRNKALQEAVNSVIRFQNPSGASLAIGSVMLEDRTWCRSFINLSRQRLAEAYKLVTAKLEEIGIPYFRGVNAGFFVWIDLSHHLPRQLDGEANREFALAKRLKEAGVFLHPKEEHAIEPGWFRVVYTQDPRIVIEGLRRLGNALENLR